MVKNRGQRGGGGGGRGGRGGNQNREDEARGGGASRGRANGRRGNGNRGSHNDGTLQTIDPIGMEKLKTLAEKKCDADLIQGLTVDGSFYALINKEQQPHDDCRRLILRVLSRASQFNMALFRHILTGLLRHVAESQFLQKWLPNDVLQLRDQLYPFSTATDAEKEEFIEEATNLLAEILDKLPDLAMEIRQTATIIVDTLKDKHAFREFRGPDGEEPPFRRAQRRLEMLWENYVERKRQQPDQAQQMQADDFVKEAPNGGCSEMCDTRMACGHVCNQRCHPTDPRHEKTRCARQCEKTCPQGHKCPKLCSDDCGDCQVRVEKKLQCGHTVKAKCHQSHEEIRCSERCNKLLPYCGHHCQQRCSDPWNPAKCFETMQRQLPCGHVATLPYNRDIANYLCMEKVTKRMPTCGHVNELACSDDVHSVRCSTPCGAILTCGDPCSGTCGQCRRGRLHKKCEEDCKRILLCGHECKEKCSKACPPCQNQCENRCVHSRCGGEKGKKGRTCGEPCPLCVEQCAWSCGHHKCNLLCYQPCQRKRCTEKCEKKLKCGHDCIGVCGETCPELCRQCDEQKYEDLLEQHDLLMPIDEEEKDTAMFVQLDDCKHLFEVSFLDTWFDEMISQAKTEKAAEIKLLQCPLCNTKVRTTQRYGVVFKECLLDVQQVKTKRRGDFKELEEQRTQLAVHVGSMLELKTGQRWGCFKKATAALLNLVTKSEPCHLTKNRLTSWENLVQLLEQLAKFEETDVLKLETMLGPRRLSSTVKQSAASRFIDQFFPMSGSAAMDNELKRKELVNLIQRETTLLLNWIVRNAKSPSDQMIQEFANECRRVVLLAGLVEILLWMTNKGGDIRSQHWTQVEEIMAVFNGVNTFNAELKANTAEKIKRLSTACGCNTGLGISETERVEILKAMGFGPGHWFKCPNGHIYCIGECGGARQEGTCPECHAGIGGASNRLRSDNALASEMDGATQSAYDAREDAAVARRLQMWEHGLNLDL